jgi:hypothetical protein
MARSKDIVCPSVHAVAKVDSSRAIRDFCGGFPHAPFYNSFRNAILLGVYGPCLSLLAWVGGAGFIGKHCEKKIANCARNDTSNDSLSLLHQDALFP